MGRRRGAPKPITLKRHDPRAATALQHPQQQHEEQQKAGTGAGASSKDASQTFSGKRGARAALIAQFHAALAKGDRELLARLGGVDAYQKASIMGSEARWEERVGGGDSDEDEDDAVVGERSLKRRRKQAGVGRAAGRKGGVAFSSAKWVLQTFREREWFGFIQGKREKKRQKNAVQGGQSSSGSGSSSAGSPDEFSSPSDSSSVGDQSAAATPSKKRRKTTVDGSADVESPRRDGAARQERARVLDVGALDVALFKNPRVECVAIDIHPQHRLVRKIDFFDYVREFRGLPARPREERGILAELDSSTDSASSAGDDDDHHPLAKTISAAAPVNSQDSGPFDAVVLSLVLNFVPDKLARGRMLAEATHLLRSDGQGALLVVLPKACVQNARYLNHERFVEILETLRFRLVEHRISERGKLAFYVLLYEPRRQIRAPREFRRDLLSPGPTRNNFAIFLDEEAIRSAAWYHPSLAIARAPSASGGNAAKPKRGDKRR